MCENYTHWVLCLCVCFCLNVCDRVKKLVLWGTAILIAGLGLLSQSLRISFSSGTIDIQLKWGGRGGSVLITPKGNSKGMLWTWWPANAHSSFLLIYILLLYTFKCMFIYTQSNDLCHKRVIHQHKGSLWGDLHIRCSSQHSVTGI